MPSVDVASGSPYRHLRLEVSATPARTRRPLVVAGALVAGALTQTSRLVPVAVEHPVDAGGVRVAPRVVHFADDDEVEPLRGVVAFAPGDGCPVAVRADGSAFYLANPSYGLRNVAEVATPVRPGPWLHAPTEIDGVTTLNTDVGCGNDPTNCLRYTHAPPVCNPRPGDPARDDGRRIADYCRPNAEGGTWCATQDARCRRTADGRVVCRGLVANGRVNRHRRPHPVASPLRFTSLAARGNVTCGITAARRVACWGPAVRSVDGVSDATSLVLRADEACALTADGSAWCWHPTRSTPPLRRPLSVATASVANAEPRAWLLDDGRVVVRDDAASSQRFVLGDLPRARQVVDGDEHACALARDGVAWCWGDNQRGQLGLDDAVTEEDWHVVMIARR